MRSVTSYFKISPAIVRDDFRRFWVVPVAAFFFYFFGSIFYILMNMKNAGNNDYLASFIENLLCGAYLPNIFTAVWLPVLSVLLVFRYLHNPGHTISVHSQPFTRAALINSHTVSCIIFIVLPILLTGIILLVLAHPVYHSHDWYDSSDEMVNVFARVNILRWMWESLLTMLFVMAVSIIAGMVTGTSFHHALAAVGFNFVAPACTMMLMLYFEIYLFGYTSSELLLTIAGHMTPVLNKSNTAFDFLSGGEYVYYVILTLLLYALAMFLYYRRKLERATEGIVFRAVDVIVTLVFGYLGMTALGMTFYAVFDMAAVPTVVGYIAGALLGMLIVRMVIMKTVRIFNRSTAIMLGGYLAVALVFFGCLSFDIFGYESHVENNADVISVGVTFYSDYGGNGSDLDIAADIEDEDSKAAAVALQRFIIENKSVCRKYADNGQSDEHMAYVSFNYYNEKGTDDLKCIESRQYDVPAYLLICSDEMEALSDSEAVKDSLADSLPDEGIVRYMQINSGKSYWESPYGVTDDYDGVCSDRAQVKELYSAVEKDLSERTYQDKVNNYDLQDVVVIDMMYDSDDNASSYVIDDNMMVEATYDYYYGVDCTAVGIDTSFTNTIAWLNANGYGDLIKYDMSYFDFAVAYEVEGGVPVGGEGDYSFGATADKPDGAEIYTDSETIQSLYENAHSHCITGALDDISTAGNGLYLVKFYRHQANLQDGYYECFSAFVDGKYI